MEKLENKVAVITGGNSSIGSGYSAGIRCRGSFRLHYGTAPESTRRGFRFLPWPKANLFTHHAYG
jgi:NAD(P)-dependent dehydrogenase (short-subunit alcohol dehydrogenase family)